jgi:nitrite reductase (NADH) small subunit/3-phenylpropionate/trans-cinnamate dioxygenase ferredoxin subunit
MEPIATDRKASWRPLDSPVVSQRRSPALSAETFHTVARVGEIPEGEGRPFEVDGRMIAVFREGDRYYALDDVCPHQGAPLSDGIVEDKCVTCTWHGWRFSLQDGRWMDSPRTRVPCYPVRVVGEEIQVGV